MHPDPALHIVAPMRVRRDRKRQTLVAHRVVVPHNPLLLHAQDVRKRPRARPRHERRTLAFRRNRKPRVVRRHKRIPQKAVRRHHILDPGKAQFLRQTLLQRPEHALRPAPRLRRVGRDQIDAQLPERPTDLRRLLLVHLPPGLRRAPVVAPAIRIKRAEQAMRLNHLAQRRKTAHRPLLGHEKRRVNLARRIVHRHNQVPPTPRNPLMTRPIPVQHHPGQRTTRALATMRPATRGRANPAMRLQRQTNPVVTPTHAVLRHQLLVEVLRREVPVARVEQIKHPRNLVNRSAARRHTTETAVVKSLRSLRLIPVTPAPERPLADAQNLRSLQLAQRAAARSPVNLLEPHKA